VNDLTFDPTFDPTFAVISRGRRPKRRRGSATIGKHSLPTCAASGKIRYRDHHQANDALSSTKWRRRLDELSGIESKRNETRSYRCGECRGWHITSLATWVEMSRPDLSTPA